MSSKVQKRTMIVLSIALAVVIAIGGTLAYLSAMTDQYDNVFSFESSDGTGGNIRARLDEPNWDPDDGKNVVPGAEIRKDPMITNTSRNDCDEFAAIRVTFTTGVDLVDGVDVGSLALDDAQTARLLRLIDISYNEGTGAQQWTRIDSNAATANGQIWEYNSQLAPGEISYPLFNSVTIKGNFATDAEADVAYAAANSGAARPAGMTNNEIWSAEYAWLASIIMTHTESCFDYETCDCGATDVRHHALCATNATPAGICDCNTVASHDAECASVAGILKADCGCSVVDGIKGFGVSVQGAVVQAGVDGMEQATDAATKAALISLFTANPYTGPVA